MRCEGETWDCKSLSRCIFLSRGNLLWCEGLLCCYSSNLSSVFTFCLPEGVGKARASNYRDCTLFSSLG